MCTPKLLFMKKIMFLATILLFVACNQKKSNETSEDTEDNKQLAILLENYYNQRMNLYPMESTMNGDTRYNNLLPADFTDSYRKKLKTFYTAYNDSISKYNEDELNNNDKKSYSIFKYQMEMELKGLSIIGASYFPFDQFNGIPLTLGQMGGGTGIQPFKTVKDYDNWLQRVAAFTTWSDSAIVYFKKGISSNYMLPKSVVIKMIPQMNAMLTKDASSSLFYSPIKSMPASFSESDKKRLTASFIDVINNQLVPSYKKLGDFLKNEYLPKARTTTGINALSGGDAYYNYLVKYWTTTDKNPQEIYNTGLSEVKRIKTIMERIKDSVGFKGDLNAFFSYMKTDKKFMPYKTPAEVLAAFNAIHTKMEPNLKKMFTLVPKTKFEIRQTEAFRAASASAEYYQGLPDGSRPGIFYVPIVDATKFNTTSGMESLFLHEAIPGHHYQCSLQIENEKLPKFRRFIWYGAYGEGYALYCESLGKELGLYTDPYQYMGALGDEMHRAIRLVVDVAMHTGKMTREDAIKYMMDNEAISEEGAVAEIERYMVMPAQALSYKTGALKIRELREKYSKELGPKFSISAFHGEFLKDGCMPLGIMEKSMDTWAETQK